MVQKCTAPPAHLYTVPCHPQVAKQAHPVCGKCMDVLCWGCCLEMWCIGPAMVDDPTCIQRA